MNLDRKIEGAIIIDIDDLTGGKRKENQNNGIYTVFSLDTMRKIKIIIGFYSNLCLTKRRIKADSVIL